MAPAGFQVLVAPDKFAGTLTAHQAAAALAAGWCRARPQDRIDTCPMSDGGPGFLDVVAGAGNDVDRSTVTVDGPDGRPVPARLLVVERAGRREVYLEAADACGLHLAPDPRRPLAMVTDGVADLLHAAVSLGAQRVVVGVGGTASTDGGAGMVRRWRERHGPWPAGVALVAAVDVAVPLLGEDGDALDFAPQKGATASDVEILRSRLSDWAAGAGGDPALAGTGAGGGLGFGLALLGGRLVPGGELVADHVDLTRRAEGSDVVLTGEGRLDATSAFGKVVAVVARANPHPPTLALVGADALPAAQRTALHLQVASLEARFGPARARSAPAARLADLAAEVAASRW